MQTVIGYRAFYHAQSNSGRVYLRLDSGEDAEIAADSPAEFSAMLEVLRRHPEVMYEEEQGLLVLPWRKPGTA
ncbi:MAG TPA: hypothetical protein VD971_01495 [Phycisphaerales bacterium]|nr:hypothetical protein [Phycisphaerales bacterium]